MKTDRKRSTSTGNDRSTHVKRKLTLDDEEKCENIVNGGKSFESSPAAVRRRRMPRSSSLNNLDTDLLLSPPNYGKRGELKKEHAIRQAIDAKDFSKLRQLAISKGGLLNNNLRQRAWPLLLHVNEKNMLTISDVEHLHSHRDYQQVVLDVNRTLKRFPPEMDSSDRMSMQEQLVDVIMRILVECPELHYYQGYHDICLTFLLVLGEDMTCTIMEKLSRNHLRDFMYETMEKTKERLSCLYPLLARSNPELYEFLERSEVGSVFCLSWLITWFGHVVNGLDQIIRMYDFFVASHPLMPMYLTAAIVLHRAELILSMECDMCILHGLLSKVPDDLPFEQLIIHAGDLFLLYPPEQLLADTELHIQQEKKKSETMKQPESLARPLARNQQASLLTLQRWNNQPWFRMTMWSAAAAVSAVIIVILKPSWYHVLWRWDS